MRIPVAHGEGRFLMTDELLAELVRKNLTAFRYSDDAGKVREDFPVNPNGALYNLAAVTNPAGNVMAIMPHPERSTAGDPIFSSMREYIEKHAYKAAAPLEYAPAPYTIEKYVAPQKSTELLIDLVITDNEAISMQNALHHAGINAQVTRQTHWEIIGSPDLNAIHASGELYNSNKEKVIESKPQSNSTSFLVRYKDDFVGQAKKDTLTNHLGVKGINSLRKGVLWNITAEDGKIEDVASRILDTHILFNPFSQDCFRYF
ncbi:MAG: phosphoribosylformylglycinamidine synthase subunit PurQ [Candidatus Kerfeldbacteria bacterium]|nr:phosphoribosylformylglycinamidine synthase subunit PurQ [Candidatus Kerfeldbacteria bacterium]